MKPRRWPFALVVGLLALAAVLGGAVGLWNIKRGPVVQTLRMAQLAPLPPSAHDVTAAARPDGRDYDVDVGFAAPLADIDAWIQRSPTARTLAPARPDAHTRRYALPTLPQAKSAQLTVDELAGHVAITLVH